MDCKTFSHINEHGTKSYKYKKKYDTLDDAILECKIQNAMPIQIIKVVSYKCRECNKYHIGRNGNPLTEKYKESLNKELDLLFPSRGKRNKHIDIFSQPRTDGNAVDTRFEGATFKVIGSIDLSKIPKK